VKPSGEQHELVAGPAHAVVVEVGGGLRSFAVAGREVLLGYGEDELCTAGRGQVLAPWPNRVADGRYVFEGCELQLALTEPERRTAIHGLVRFAGWSAVERSASSVTMGHVLHPQPGYPFALRLAVRYELSPDGLAVTATAENAGAGPCPFGLGFHPYLAGAVDELALAVPAGTRIVTDDQGVEQGREPCDLRELRPVGPRRIDATCTDLERGPDGLARVRAGAATLWFDASFPFLQVFSGDLPSVGRLGLAVEPMTCAPNAFRSGDGLLRLEPGDRFEGSWGIRVTDPAPGEYNV
jgi:aldose 1-epimerase